MANNKEISIGEGLAEKENLNGRFHGLINKKKKASFFKLCKNFGGFGAVIRDYINRCLKAKKIL